MLESEEARRKMDTTQNGTCSINRSVENYPTKALQISTGSANAGLVVKEEAVTTYLRLRKNSNWKGGKEDGYRHLEVDNKSRQM